MLKGHLHSAIVTLVEAAYVMCNKTLPDIKKEKEKHLEWLADKAIKLFVMAGNVSSRDFSRILLKKLTKLERKL